MRRLSAPLIVALVVVGAVAPVAPAHSHRRVLASGDSMIQIIDDFLLERLKPYHLRVKRDAHVGTGLSKPFQLNWPRHARKMARRYHPRASVVFIGANDGFPLRYHGKRRDCCSRAWTKAYAVRARRMMRALERGGRSRVYWFTIPAARPHRWNHIYRHVNRGIEIAANEERDRGVELVDLRPIFTPTGHYRRSIKRHGRRVVVRQSDGIHLNRAGARIAARVVARRMRRDGLLHR
jgi:hypothetical protein